MKIQQAFCASAIMLAIAVWCTPVMAQDDSNAAAAQGTAAADDEVIHLHMPVHHSVHHRTPQPAAPASVDAIGAEPGATAEVPAAAPVEAATSSARKTKHTSNPAPAPAIPLSLGDEGSESPAPPPVAVPPSPAPHAVKTASIPPHEATQGHATSPLAASGESRVALTKHGDVLFQKGVSDPSPAQFKGVKLLAGDLNSALEAGASRIQLEAYGGAPGDKSSDARRLSLKRALAVRQLLIDNGVPSNRIDVRAMGGVDDKGPTDRVDVFVRAG
ncbi:MAG TPA: OmpA family protein [Rhizomicrobium sp.]|nr:OmpA family protein [Rhizomicrobium sp.]